MEPRTSSEISAGSATPIPGGLDTSFPPEVVEVVRKLCEGLRPSEKEWMDVAALLLDKFDLAESNREDRHNTAEWFPKQYSFDNNIKEERTCIWRKGSASWIEKSSGIIWVAVHGARTICVVTKKGDLDRGRLRASCFKLIPEEKVRALFRRFIMCEIEDLVDPPTELRQSIKKPSRVDPLLSTALRQSLQESIKKPFGVVSADNGSGKKASSDVCYEEKAIEFLTEKMNRDTRFNVEETIKTAVGAFQCLFPEKLKATEIEVSIMNPMYRADIPVDENTYRSVWEVPTNVLMSLVGKRSRRH